jgi:hypothetical protein
VADIVFVLDSSGSIRDQNPADGSYDNWQLLLEFMVKMVDKLNVGSNHVRIGAVKFSTEAESVFHLNQYTDKTSLITAIRRIKYMGGHTNTAGGIRIMNNEEFTIGNGDRSNVQNIAIVITDGESTRDVENTIPEAIQARNRGIKIYSVGITKNINEDELRKISSQPQLVNENYFKAADFRSLEKVAVAITSNACDNVDCLDGPLDLVLIIGFWSDATFTAEHSRKWKALIEMAKRIVDTLTVSKFFSQVGLITLGDTTKSEFFMRDGYSKAELLQRLSLLPHRVSKVSPAEAIRHAREIQFTAHFGDRVFAPDLLVFLTDETRSLAQMDVVNEIRQASFSGISVYSIGSESLNTLDLTASVAADASTERLLSTATHSASVEHSLAAMRCNAHFGERLFCGDVNTKERMCFCRFDDECDVRPANGTRCLDVDECTLNNGGCEHYCDNTQGSFRCRCKAGFQLAEDKWSCEDTNECDQQPCGNEACTNTYGSYFCGVPSVAAAAGLVGAEGAATVASGVNMSTVVTAAAMSAIAAVLVSLLVVLVARQVQQWRSSRSTPSGDHSQFNRPARNFSGFGSVSSKLSAMTMSSVDSVQEDA